MASWFGRSRLRIAGLLAFIVLLMWALVDLAIVSIGAENDQATHADVIIVLGCKAYENGQPTPCIRAQSAFCGLSTMSFMARQG